MPAAGAAPQRPPTARRGPAPPGDPPPAPARFPDAVTCLTHDLDVVLDAEEHRQPATEQLLVVDDGDPDRLTAASGTLLLIGHVLIMARAAPQVSLFARRELIGDQLSSRVMTP